MRLFRLTRTVCSPWTCLICTQRRGERRRWRRRRWQSSLQDDLVRGLYRSAGTRHRRRPATIARESPTYLPPPTRAFDGPQRTRMNVLAPGLTLFAGVPFSSYSCCTHPVRVLLPAPPPTVIPTRAIFMMRRGRLDAIARASVQLRERSPTRMRFAASPFERQTSRLITIASITVTLQMTADHWTGPGRDRVHQTW